MRMVLRTLLCEDVAARYGAADAAARVRMLLRDTARTLLCEDVAAQYTELRTLLCEDVAARYGGEDTVV